MSTPGHTPRWQVTRTDCLPAMRAMPPACIASIVTDPPYGLSFANQGWDHAVPGAPYWTAALRVAKPGAHLLAFGGTRTFHRLAVAIEDAGWELRDTIMWVYGSGMPKSHNLRGDLDGWGTGLKPAWEPIIVARAPLAGTVESTVRAHGTGALHIDACRVPHGDGNDLMRTQNAFSYRRNFPEFDRPWMHDDTSVANHLAVKSTREQKSIHGGRWPANVIHDGSADVINQFPSNLGARGNRGPTKHGGSGLLFSGLHKRQASEYPHLLSDTGGSAARFFYCAKATSRDRHEGCPGKNDHPTVKPTALMRYLVRLVTPPGDLILDPFTGSGSTGKAALLEGFRFLGFDQDPHSCELARARCRHAEDATPLLPPETPPP